MVEFFEQLRNALTLPQNRPPCHFCRVRCKHWNDPNLSERMNCCVQCDAGVSNSKKSSLQGTRLRRLARSKLSRAAAALPVVGLGEIRQLKVHGKSLCQLGSFGNGDPANDVASQIHRGLTGSARNGERSQSFDSFKEVLPLLLFDDISKQPAKRTDVAA